MAEKKTKTAAKSSGDAPTTHRPVASKKPAKVNEQAAAPGMIRIQYYRSSISTPKTHKVIVRSVGFTKLNQIVEKPDTPSMRGYVEKVPHLLRIID
jgi:large subunit ribosomal protein L30